MRDVSEARPRQVPWADGHLTIYHVLPFLSWFDVDVKN